MSHKFSVLALSVWVTNLKGTSIISACTLNVQSGQQMSYELKIKPAFGLSGQCGQQISYGFKIIPALMLSGQSEQQI